MKICWFFQWLVFLTLTISGISSVAAARRPSALRLFPFVQALQRNNNNDLSNDNQDESSRIVEYEEHESMVSADEHDVGDDEEEDDKHHVHSLLQVPCRVEIPDLHHRTTTVTTIVDTGAQVTVLSAEAAQKCGVVHLLDQRYAGEATGVGSCRVLGRIPAGALLLHLSPDLTLPSPAITVLDNDSMGMDLLLGLDFLRDAGAILNLKKEVMILSQDENEPAVVIPFVRPQTDITGSIGGWINNDILSSLENSRTRRDANEEDEEDDDDDEDEGLDMSGV